jgi:hypothetical protein
MATADEDIAQIEKDIRRLKIEYEQFFGGGRPRPPTDTQWRLENMMRRYNDRSGELGFAQRFRLNNLTQTYAKYVDMWRKKTMQKESGTSQHHFGSAAKAIEAARSEARARADSAVSGNESAVRTAQSRDAACFALSFSDPEQEKAKIGKLYQKLLDAHNESGESTSAPNLQAFERFVRKKTQELRDKGGQEIEYSVTIQEGRVKLKARISS